MGKTGYIKIVLGCMFSGKTTELIREYREWASINKKPLCINFIDDNRYGNIYNNMYNHNELSVECLKVSKLQDINIDFINNSEIILINEGQFFSDLVKYVLLWCEKYNKTIIVSGLDGDYKRCAFGEILELIPFANEVIKLNAFCANCRDGTKAFFTHRKSNETEQIVIGANNYEALCRKCYLEKTK